MILETILYPMHISRPDEDILSVAELCANEDKHLSVLLFGDSPSPPLMTAGDTVSVEIWAQHTVEAESALKKKCLELEEYFNKNGVRSDVKYELGDGMSVDEVTGSHAVYSDLIMAQRGKTESRANTFTSRLYHGALFNAGKPLLLFGDSVPDSLNFKTILIAWDGKRSASRAVSESLPLLKAASSVYILSVDSDKQLAVGSEQADWDLSAYLARHKVSVTVDARDSRGKKISTVIQQRAIEVGADLIVTGSYSRSRLRERIFGGTTSEMLEQCSIPLLMSR